MRQIWAKARRRLIRWRKQSSSRLCVTPFPVWWIQTHSPLRTRRYAEEIRSKQWLTKKRKAREPLTEEAPSENTVQITFLPEGKTVTFEHGKLAL